MMNFLSNLKIGAVQQNAGAQPLRPDPSFKGQPQFGSNSSDNSSRGLSNLPFGPLGKEKAINGTDGARLNTMG